MRKRLALILLTSIWMVSCGTNMESVEEHSTEDTAKTWAGSDMDNIILEQSTEEESEAAEIEKPEFAHDWQSLYYDQLAPDMDPPDDIFDEKMFNLYDLDSNGTPELIISEGISNFAAAYLYTVQQGELISLGGYGSMGLFLYDFEHDYISSYFIGQGIAEETLYKFENGGVTELVTFADYSGTGEPGPPKYQVNDEFVSIDVYLAEQEKYSFIYPAYPGESENFNIREYKITKTTLEDILRNAALVH